MPTPSTRPESLHWIAAGSEAALVALAPLIEAHRALRPVLTIPLKPGEVVPANGWSPHLSRAAAALVVGPQRRSARTALPGIFLHDPAGRPVPAGWLPDAGGDALSRFAQGAAQVVRRAAAGMPYGPVALLSQWDERALRMAERTDRVLRGHSLPVVRWTSDRIVRRDLLVALRIGVGIAFYMGHGRPVGWAGYSGLHNRHIAHARGEPQGAVLSLACNVASRPRAGLSFAESLVLHGVAAAALGAVQRTLHIDNGHWVIDLCRALLAGAGTLGDLLLLGRRTDTRGAVRCERRYRIVGDPLAPLCGASEAANQAAGVFAPALGDPLPPLYPISSR